MNAQSWFNTVVYVALISLSNPVWAGSTPEKLPDDEKGFVDAVSKLKRSEIVAVLGEPARAEDVKLKDSGRIVASIWHYHNVTKDAQGEFYPTTELDIIDDQVTVVVFMNNDGSDPEEGKVYEVPAAPPTQDM
jgi:hypothetical protein